MVKEIKKQTNNLLKFTGRFNCCTFKVVAEQKARATYEKLIDLCKDDKDVVDILKYLRQREIVHFQRFGEALNGVEEKLAQKKFYMNGMDKVLNNNCNNN